MALNKEIFSSDLAQTFKQDNSFSSLITNMSEFVDGKYVHIPNVGTYSGDLTTDSATYPLSGVIKRTDLDNQITMRHTTIKQIVVDTPIENVEFNYNKRMSVYGDVLEEVVEEINSKFILDLVPTVNTGTTIIFATTGTGRAAHSPDQTGNRSGVTITDIRKASQLFNIQNLPKEGRVMLIPSYLENDILELDQFKYTDELNRQIMVEGFLGRVNGFDVYTRGDVLVSLSGGTIKSTQVVTATDGLAILFFSTKTIGKALGETKIIYDENNTSYQAPVFSGWVRNLAFNKNKTEKGIAILYEATA